MSLFSGRLVAVTPSGMRAGLLGFSESDSG